MLDAVTPFRKKGIIGPFPIKPVIIGAIGTGAAIVADRHIAWCPALIEFVNAKGLRAVYLTGEMKILTGPFILP